MVAIQMQKIFREEREHCGMHPLESNRGGNTPKGMDHVAVRQMPPDIRTPPLKGDSTRKWAEEQLRKELLRHVQESHQEDFSQAAVRIVREATEQK